MRILIITQVFYPDTVSVSQHLTDLATKLSQYGHDVTVYTSKYPYEDKTHFYTRYENHKGIKIIRLRQSSFGKGNFLARIMDFLTFYISISVRLFLTRKNQFDLMIGTTVPPLLSFLGVIISRIWGIKFNYWVMDLQPELSISSGIMKKDSISARFFSRIGDYIIRNSHNIISLDRFMTDYLYSRGAKSNSIKTIAVWPVMEEIYKGSRMANPYRIRSGFGNKIVIMYSGNHAYVHKLDTLLEAALILKSSAHFLFVFIGGGIRKKDVTEFKIKYNMTNIVQLPFEPRENIHNSLGSADIQVVVLGDGQVGYTHPNKIYGAMYVGKPILYIGPSESHVVDILNDLQGNICVQHGEATILAEKIESLFSMSWSEINRIGEMNLAYAENNFNPEILKNKMITAVL